MRRGEFYLTDVPALAQARWRALRRRDVAEDDALGVNSRAELAEAEAACRQRLRAKALAAGVGMIAPETVFLSHDTVLDADVADRALMSCSGPA